MEEWQGYPTNPLRNLVYLHVTADTVLLGTAMKTKTVLL